MNATPVLRAALLGDVVASRADPDRAALQERLVTALAATDTRVPPWRPLRMTIGDEFQALYEDLGAAVAATLQLRLLLADGPQVRIGIGWGELTLGGEEGSPYGQDGPCWWRAREALEALEEAEGSNLAPWGWRTAVRTGGSLDELLNGYLMLRDHLLGGLDTTDVEILRGLDRGDSQRAIADRLGLHPSSVSRRARSHGLLALLRSTPAELEPT